MRDLLTFIGCACGCTLVVFVEFVVEVELGVGVIVGDKLWLGRPDDPKYKEEGP